MDKKDIDERKAKINIFGKTAGLFIGQFQLTILVILLITAIGISGLLNLPKESLPEIVFPSITVQTFFLGASPEDVESLVTEKIENKVKDFDDIESLESESSFGLSIVSISFNEGVDINQKKIEIDNALREISFSDGVSDPKTLIFTTSEIPLMNISVVGNYPLSELTAITEELANEIEAVRGVDSVSIAGDVEREIEVVMNEFQMMKYNITFNDVKNALQGKNFSAPIGELSLNGVRYNLRVDERYTAIDEIENTLIKNNIYIKDIASVVDGLKEISTYNRTYIKGEEVLPSLFITVNRKVASDVIGTSDDVKELLETTKVLPIDVNVYVSNDLSKNVQSDLDNIQDSAWSGLLVVIVVLFLFIGFKESIIVSLTIPLSLLGTLGLLSLFDITFNTFAILGLIVALGLLVDNSIIVMENIDRLRKKGFTANEAALYGTNQVGLPISSATLTTLAAFFPLAILPGILGAFVSTIPKTIMITISVSLLVSLVITPSLSSKILKMKKRVHLNKFVRIVLGTGLVTLLSYLAFRDIDNVMITYIMTGLFSLLMLLRMIFLTDKGLEETRLTRSYSKLIGWIIKKKRRTVLVLFIGFSVLGLSIMSITSGLLKISFFPKGEPTSLNILIDTPGGTTLEDTGSITGQLETYLKEIEEVTQFSTTIGGTEIDSSRISVELDTSKRSGFDILNQVEELSKKIPGATISIQTVVTGPPVGKPIVIRILSDDLRGADVFSKEVATNLKGIPGVYNVESSVSVGVPEILIDINENKGLNYGISPVQITNQLRGEITGVEATSLRENGQEIDVILRKDLNQITDISQVENLFIATPLGNMLTLSSFSDISLQSGLSNITRKDGKRVITIEADLKEGYNVNDVVSEFRSSIDIPNGIEIKYSGDVEGIDQNFGNLFQSMIVAVFLVFIILTLQFRSIGQPFIILTTLPMAFIGVIWGLIITGNEFGFYAFMGLVALIGIAVNDAIVLIDYINQLKSQGYTIIDAIIEAGETRFNPVLATTLTTISGVLPLAFKESYYAQFSFSLIFGLMVTTILTLIFIPTIYRLFSKNRKAVKS
ncbi:efflux RND transporter permease subunit [Acidaminobacter sp. JC074]|uniref:efflux RND transporter permease subunit n=1 Tax=Acidaminobacter sp. JC074 TaxID=2530199 RepID=UPI001F0E2DFD|nr:efflux RND transporter permease subunit [Acidaminobacter sp. JC074]MCH4888451.1 efflux RND transporter permease subunit [Acidaminobacter sp. JC074]